MTEEMRNVIDTAGNKVVEADNLVSQCQQPLAQVASQKA